MGSQKGFQRHSGTPAVFSRPPRYSQSFAFSIILRRPFFSVFSRPLAATRVCHKNQAVRQKKAAKHFSCAKNLGAHRGEGQAWSVRVLADFVRERGEVLRRFQGSSGCWAGCRVPGCRVPRVPGCRVPGCRTNWSKQALKRLSRPDRPNT